jgi:hypothetical protein
LAEGRLEKIVGTALGVTWSGFALTPPSERCGRVRLTVRAGEFQRGTAEVEITGRFGPDGLSDVRCQGVTCRVNRAQDRPVTLVKVG